MVITDLEVGRNLHLDIDRAFVICFNLTEYYRCRCDSYLNSLTGLESTLTNANLCTLGDFI